DRGIHAVSHVLELALDEVDRALPRALTTLRGATWKPSAKDDAGGFRQHLHVRAELLADELEHRRLPRSRSAGQHNPAPVVRLHAPARPHLCMAPCIAAQCSCIATRSSAMIEITSAIAATFASPVAVFTCAMSVVMRSVFAFFFAAISSMFMAGIVMCPIFIWWGAWAGCWCCS